MNCRRQVPGRIVPTKSHFITSPYIPSRANKPATRLVHLIHSIFRTGMQFTCYRYFYPRYKIVLQSAGASSTDHNNREAALFLRCRIATCARRYLVNEGTVMGGGGMVIILDTMSVYSAQSNTSLAFTNRYVYMWQYNTLKLFRWLYL